MLLYSIIKIEIKIYGKKFNILIISDLSNIKMLMIYKKKLIAMVDIKLYS
jgi:hypothetical protein